MKYSHRKQLELYGYVDQVQCKCECGFVCVCFSVNIYNLFQSRIKPIICGEPLIHVCI